MPSSFFRSLKKVPRLFNSTAFSIVCIWTVALLVSAHCWYVRNHVEVAFDVFLFLMFTFKKSTFASSLSIITHTWIFCFDLYIYILFRFIYTQLRKKTSNAFFRDIIWFNYTLFALLSSIATLRIFCFDFEYTQSHKKHRMSFFKHIFYLRYSPPSLACEQRFYNSLSAPISELLQSADIEYKYYISSLGQSDCVKCIKMR